MRAGSGESRERTSHSGVCTRQDHSEQTQPSSAQTKRQACANSDPPNGAEECTELNEFEFGKENRMIIAGEAEG